ncbi:MAG: type II restriction endonuclease [Candidatus Cloacimonadaceae bacterium]
MKRDFEGWFVRFKTSIYDYSYYVDFPKVIRNVDSIKIELNLLNSLIGSQDLDKDFRTLVEKYPETLKCIPILLAVRRLEIFARDQDGDYLYNFAEMNYSPEQYLQFMRKTGLYDLLANKSVTNLVDYVLGVETGLDSNARKNRGGILMENLVEHYIQKAGFERDLNYFKEMKSSVIETRWGLDLSALTHSGSTTKQFDFVVKTDTMLYAIETNFYASEGSKLNETARSYKMLASEARNISGFTFVWITDGAGWHRAKNNLQETFDTLPTMYCIAEMENGILSQVLV